MLSRRLAKVPERIMATGWTPSVAGPLLLCLLLPLPSGAARAADAAPGPLRPVSGPSPFTGCAADGVSSQPGQVYMGSEVEPWITVNPANPLNMVAAWQQDRWSNGGARGLVVGVTLDGGETWEPVVVPGLTPCSGGNLLRASDPWASFGPTGELFHSALALTQNAAAPNAILVSRSSDGGLTWFPPKQVIFNSWPRFNDKEAITADPTDPRFAYVAWDRLDFAASRGPAMVSRTDDGGLSWETAQAIHDPGRNNQTLGAQVLVRPDGTVYTFFAEILSTGTRFLSFKTSADKGATWQPALGARRTVFLRPAQARDPQLGVAVRDAANLFDVAVDPRDGALYAVWQDGSPNGFQYPEILYTRSVDGGQTWSGPRAVNATPRNVLPPLKQAFLPSIHVSDNGTVGISYYDFRNDGAEPDALADHWFAWCHPRAVDCTRSDRWQEIRLTEASFDYLLAPFARGLFLGDYVGLAADGADFVALFTQTHDMDASSVFFRRVRMVPRAEPEGLGFWKHQARVAAGGPGRAQEDAARLIRYLVDAQALHDVFDDLLSVEQIAATLDPPRPAGPRARARAHLLALVFNLASGRLDPFIPAGAGADAAGVAEDVATVLEDAGASRADLLAAAALAEAVNEGAAR